MYLTSMPAALAIFFEINYLKNIVVVTIKSINIPTIKQMAAIILKVSFCFLSIIETFIWFIKQSYIFYR